MPKRSIKVFLPYCDISVARPRLKLLYVASPKQCQLSWDLTNRHKKYSRPRGNGAVRLASPTIVGFELKHVIVWAAAILPTSSYRRAFVSCTPRRRRAAIYRPLCLSFFWSSCALEIRDHNVRAELHTTVELRSKSCERVACIPPLSYSALQNTMHPAS